MSSFRKKVFLMSKLILLIFILLLSINSAALAFPNEPTSFRGLSWGASIEELKEKYPNSYEIKDDRVNTLIKQIDGTTLISYGTYLENDSISNIPIVAPIEYTFWNNQLESVHINISGDSVAMSSYNEKKMLAALEDLYGECSSKFEEPFTDEPFTRMYFWEGPVCKIMFFSNYHDKGKYDSNVFLWLSSQKISSERLAQAQKTRRSQAKQGW
ncbi:hypothetical protein F3D40_26500 [Bacteroides ovatus]|nr:hypothetical protein F3D40_26500 [Bacteroides ovatus]KAA4434686.1 hypothetical protein F3C84_26940 [Bacteroides ovatus]